ncbi:hypothetical protein SAMN05216234_10118 [Hydrogenimonas thermophila]|uniref:Uncharacterized protein n=2 Tax=Hydrogenimonas thermophila TaxID=223786 RepID=A0A1I5KPA0_9BACT|nr:hypothetical protein SAMN05216234_10118 [Hydrogenimonas thermophila]
MKYIYLNQICLENFKSSLMNETIIEFFKNLIYLLKNLREIEVEIIFDSNISQFKYNNQSLYYFLKNLPRDMKEILLVKITKNIPFCSNEFDEYSDNENIVLGDCKIKEMNIDILDSFLACALYHNAPILSTKLCDIEELTKEYIFIECKNNSHKLANFCIENKNEIVDSLNKNYQNEINNWQKWKESINVLYKFVNITDECFEELCKYSFNSVYGKIVRNFMKNIDYYIKKNESIHLDFSKCCSNTKIESDTRLIKFKRELSIVNCNGNKEIANWHTWINKDFRLYFTIDKINNKICFIKFCKKII